MIFYINVAEDSRILKEAKEPTVNAKDIPSRLRGDAVGQDMSGMGATAGAAVKGGVVGAGAGVIANGAKGGIRGVTKSALKGAAVGAATNAAGTAVVSIAAGGKMARQQKRLTKAIALHVPNQLAIRYNMNWDAADTMASQLANAGISDGVVGAAKTAGTAAVVAALTKAPGADLASAQSGLAANPKKENLFKSVDFRTFTFEYQFFPRNPTEAANVLNIVKEFKLHMHPEFKDSNNFLFIYPSEFDIFYYNNGSENMNLHRHTSYVLTEMNVNYTPNSQFTTFEGGMPTQINVTLSLLELSILTKEKIQENFKWLILKNYQRCIITSPSWMVRRWSLIAILLIT